MSKYRIKEVKNITNSGDIISEWYVQKKYKYFPFWITFKEIGYSGGIFNLNYGSKENAELEIRNCIENTEIIYHNN